MATSILLDCDPGHDDAMAILLALASPELELLGVTTVAGNQTLAKTTANALRVLDFVGREDVPVAAGADRPLERDAIRRQRRARRERPRRPRPTRAEARGRRGRCRQLHGGSNLRGRAAGHARRNRAPDECCGPDRAVSRGGRSGRSDRRSWAAQSRRGTSTPAAEFNIWADPEAAARVFSSGLDVT